MTVNISSDRFIAAAVSATTKAGLDSIFFDEKARVALDLLNSVLTETSTQARFLFCVIGLEVLSTTLPKHPIAQKLLDEMQLRIDSLRKNDTTAAEEIHALESLEREICFRREESLRSSVRRMIIETYTDLPESERIDLARKVIKAYDLRGTLVHDGVVAEGLLSESFQTAYDTLHGAIIRRTGLLKWYSQS